MRTTTYTCDRCGVTIDDGRALVVIQAGPIPPAWSTDPETGRPGVDLCSTCLDSLASWLAQPHSRDEVRNPTP
jgi:hypothetical protein